MTDIDKLSAELDRINKWREANLHLIGGPAFRRSTLVHRQLTDLIAVGGGSPEDRAGIVRELTAIYEGKRDEETANAPQCDRCGHFGHTEENCNAPDSVVLANQIRKGEAAGR